MLTGCNRDFCVNEHCCSNPSYKNKSKQDDNILSIQKQQDAFKEALSIVKKHEHEDFDSLKEIVCNSDLQNPKAKSI